MMVHDVHKNAINGVKATKAMKKGTRLADGTRLAKSTKATQAVEAVKDLDGLNGAFNGFVKGSHKLNRALYSGKQAVD